MIDMLKLMMAHAVGQYGRDRFYTVTFGASTPIVRVFEDGDQRIQLCEFWAVNDVIHEKKLY